MFELFKPRDGKAKDSELTSLDLRGAAPITPQPAPNAVPKTGAQPAAAQSCVQIAMNLEAAYGYFTGAYRKFQAITKVNLKPELVFYVVFPQQGHSHTITSTDGTKTILPIFNNRSMADAYIAARLTGAVVAVMQI